MRDLMIIHLMESPWAARPRHVVSAASASEWRNIIVGTAPPAMGMLSAAVIVEEMDAVKPFAVQWLNGAKWPQHVMSNDGFLMVRTGLHNLHLAADQWGVIAAFPAQIMRYESFLGGMRDFTRRAAYKPLREVEDESR